MTMVQSAGDVVASMERRAAFAHELPGAATLEVRVLPTPRASALRILWRGVQWSLAFVIFGLKRIKDRASGDRSVETRGRRLREVFEWMGGTAIKIGQQLAVRVDFLPIEICRELAKLMDRVPPFHFRHAVARIEEAAGALIDEVFTEIEPEPIGSASIACVFRATRHSGERVAVKVRRPGVDEVFAADMALIELWTKALEWLTVVRADFFKYLRSELRDMLYDELDFVKEANYQAMFRRYVKRDRLRWVSAPRVHADLSNHRVLTSDFAEGYSCLDILAAVETRDAEALDFLERMDVNPTLVGERIMQLGLWSRLECPFFHSDPHPGNILVLPGSRLVMLDFGACGIASRKHAEHQIEMSRRLMSDDIVGGAAVSLSLLAPLPALDVAALRRRLEQKTWDYHIVLKSKDAQWWERTSAAIWIAMIEGTRDFNLPINLDVLRMARATLLYDTLACRLNPRINAKNAFRRWLRASSRRARRRLERQSNLAARAGYAMLVSELGSLADTFEKGTFWAAHMTRELPKEFISTQSKGAFFAATLLRSTARASLLVALVALALLVRAGLGGELLGFRRMALAVVMHPAAQLLLAVFLVRALRRVQSRLADKDPS